MSKFSLKKNGFDFQPIISVGLLFIAVFTGLLVRNSAWGDLYIQSFHRPISLFHTTQAQLNINVFDFVNEVLMTFFFIVVSIDIKKEFFKGTFRSTREVILPSVAALGGVVLPATLYLLLTRKNIYLMGGWAIPTATDIAFSLGILSLLGPRVPLSMKLFLSTLAIIDDLCAVTIIAVAYATSLNWVWLGVGAVVSSLLYRLNKNDVQSFVPYFVLGLLLWWALWQGGIHPTIAGVLWAALLPFESGTAEASTTLYRLERYLRPMVDYIVLPLFAFVNAGIPLRGVSGAHLTHPVFMGVFVGLALGKPLGILLGSGLLVAAGTPLPLGMTPRHLLSAACLGGVGFTMSLLIGNLAFADESLLMLMRQAVLMGSLVSACLGLLLFPKANSRFFLDSR